MTLIGYMHLTIIKELHFQVLQIFDRGKESVIITKLSEISICLTVSNIKEETYEKEGYTMNISRDEHV